MRLLLLFCVLLFFTNTLKAQPPNRMSYQAVVRDATNNLLNDALIGVQISILKGAVNGIIVYSETHSPTTNSNGLMSIEVGGGLFEVGSFSTINWADGPYFLKTAIDPLGGTNYTIIGTSQLLSVPYALYAASSGSSIPGPQGPQGLLSNGADAGNTPFWDGTMWVVNNSNLHNSGAGIGIGTNNPSPSAKLDISSSTQGFLPPRLTTSQRDAIVSPALGLTIYNVTDNCLQWWNGNVWYDGCGNNIVAGSIGFLNCSSINNFGVLTVGSPAIGVSFEVGYAGGNGGAHTGQIVSSTGITGLNAVLSPGDFLIGNGSLTYSINGTPSGSGFASFNLNIGGQSCVVNVLINAVIGANSPASCGATNVHNPQSNYGLLIDQDGNSYKTIVIGNQTWMAENLKVGHYQNGDLIPLVTNNVAWSGLSSGATCWYNNDSLTYDCPFGKLYNWYAVGDARNICPSGWHVPTDEDWSTLINFIDPNANGGDNYSNIAGGKMKSSTTQYWQSPNTIANNESGFSGMPNGYRINNGTFDVILYSSPIWSSSDFMLSNISYGFIRELYYSLGNANRYLMPKESGLSVRCVKD
jgi:uncharacterized protein (TIGR02145 family)